MTDVSYSLEAMRSLLMLGSGERGRAIETIEKLASAYDASCAERDIAAAAGVSSNGRPATGGNEAETATDDDGEAPETGDTGDGDDETMAKTPTAPADEIDTGTDTEAVHIPGTLPLGTSGKFCLAPFSPTGDFVVALDEKIIVVSLIDVIDGLNKASSE